MSRLHPRVTPRPATTHRAARGAASLIVVLLLFLVLSLTAAYTSRNLIFEQKTSANQARSTTAFEAADAGVEWTLTQLNGGRIDANCTESTSAADLSFQQRYLTIATNGNISQKPRAAGSLSPRVWPTCVFNGATLNCACPSGAAVDPTASVGVGSFPAFRVWPAVFEPAGPTASPWTVFPAPRPGLLALTVSGCTRLPASAAETCMDYVSRGEIGEGLAGVRALIALRSGLATLPAAAVTARLDVVPYPPAPAVPSSSDPKLGVVNTDQRSGFTVNTAGSIETTRFAPQGIPGTPAEFSLAPDDLRLLKTSLVAPAGSSTYGPELTGGDRMFVTTFGMRRQTYREQPGVRVCPSATCTDVNTALAENPNRIIWVQGNLALTAPLGTAAAPVLLIVDGETLTLGPGVQIHGFVYMTGGDTDTSTILLPPDAPTAITGAVVAEGRLLTDYTGTPLPVANRLTITYDAALLELLRTTYGSWVRLPGSWRDFKGTP